MSNFPFLDRIPIEDRGTAIEKLGEWQRKHYGTDLEVVIAARNKTKAAIPDITINAPAYEEEHQMDLEREVRQAPKHQARID